MDGGGSLVIENLSTEDIVDISSVRSIITKANNSFDFGRWKEAFVLYTEAHKLMPTCGHVLFRLGVMHHTGLKERNEVILQADKEIANHFFALAMEELKKFPDDPEALCDLGYMNESGYGTPKNAKEAVRYYIASAQMGYSRGQCNLAYMFEYGEGCQKDSKKAEMYYTLSANQGLARGQCNLGYMYNNGTGVPKDQKKAEEYYKMAAQQGYNKAQYNLALLYHLSETQKKLAVRYFRLASEQGHATAQRYLANIFNGKSDCDKFSYQKIAAEYLADEWPETHSLVNQKCKIVMRELHLLLKNYTNIPMELIVLTLKQVVFVWKGFHYIDVSE